MRDEEAMIVRSQLNKALEDLAHEETENENFRYELLQTTMRVCTALPQACAIQHRIVDMHSLL